MLLHTAREHPGTGRRYRNILPNGITRVPPRVSPVTLPYDSPGHASGRADPHHFRVRPPFPDARVIVGGSHSAAAPSPRVSGVMRRDRVAWPASGLLPEDTRRRPGQRLGIGGLGIGDRGSGIGHWFPDLVILCDKKSSTLRARSAAPPRSCNSAGRSAAGRPRRRARDGRRSGGSALPCAS
jgi:hypothetical protein